MSLLGVNASQVSQPCLGRGFTVIEVIMTLFVLGILSAIALPTFESAMRKSRRADAIVALTVIQQAQEHFRSNKPNYADNLTAAASATPAGLGLSSTVSNERYYQLSVALEGTGATAYVAAATAVDTRAQVSDSACKVMAVRMNGGNVQYAGNTTLASIDWTSATPDPNRCWAR